MKTTEHEHVPERYGAPNGQVSTCQQCAKPYTVQWTPVTEPLGELIPYGVTMIHVQSLFTCRTCAVPLAIGHYLECPNRPTE